jgi:hypothetical protein
MSMKTRNSSRRKRTIVTAGSMRTRGEGLQIGVLFNKKGRGVGDFRRRMRRAFAAAVAASPRRPG